MARYSEELKCNIQLRMIPPHNESVSQIARDSGLSEGTLYKWQKEARANGAVVPGGGAEPEKWSSRDKFSIVLETATLSEVELAEYCRAKGLYAEQIEAWRDACMQANGGLAQQASQLQKELRTKEREMKTLTRELKRKEAALAETAALLVLRKRHTVDLGGPRGRMISASDRRMAMELIQEAVDAGAKEEAACQEIGLTQRTLQRWRKEGAPQEDQRPHAVRPAPSHKLSEVERQQIIEVVNQPAYKSLPPSQIVPRLADEGVYMASESTFYRVMHAHGQQHHRGRSKKPVSKPLTSHCAVAANQVWMWDITWLPGPVKGLFYYLYLILDLFSRKIVGWEVWNEESAEHASTLVRRTVLSEQCVVRKEPLVLHSDNGSPMKGATLLETLYSLGITPSKSRPRVSNDNPYAESVFRTCKYRPSYPLHGFKSTTEAREWVRKFVHWYNTEHHHSGLNFLTPNQRHKGLAEQIFEKRKRVYEQARQDNPRRWSGKIRNWSLDERVYLNPEKVQHSIATTTATQA
ncbi:IS3 family transposase [Paenibacillus sp. YYML68]|uniref:IS3 family transposase n=1 Tax=Paenibacillus sp. YYML68 TaxID=2909250 RepID=UPI0037C87DBC